MSKLYNLSSLTLEQINPACEIMARSFKNDPLIMYLFPDPLERLNKSYLYYKFNILQGFLYGEVITSENLEAVAVWISVTSQERKNKDLSKILYKEKRKAILGWNQVLKEDDILRQKYESALNIIGELKSTHSNFPHCYLAMIGVDPIYQRKGYASKLIRAKFEEIDNQNLPCYLNTENEMNVSIYEHFGFDLVGKTKVPNSNFHVHAMLRKTRRAI